MSVRVPIIPTIIVLAAAATMVALGVWQLGRSEEKAGLIERYSQATKLDAAVPFPTSADGEDVWFRQSSIACAQVLAIQPVAGTADNGAKGWAMRAQCMSTDGAQILIDLGFARDLTKPDWSGGEVTGLIAPGPRLIADPAIEGLQPLAKPDPKDLPNNHLAYAGQWFFFALTALAIYGFALRSRAARKS
jgi:surfeit locus 1 family protein